MSRIRALKPSKTNPRVKRWQRVPSEPPEVEPGRGQLSLPLPLDALERTGKAPGGATRGSYLARDAAGRGCLVKPKLSKTAIQGELIGPVVARAVGLQSPENVLVLKDGKPVGIASRLVAGLRAGDDPWAHPDSMLGYSVKLALGDSDFEGASGDNVLFDPAGRLWLLDFGDANAAVMRSWLKGDPLLSDVELEHLGRVVDMYEEIAPQQRGRLVEGWQRALNQPPEVFDSASIRLAVEPSKLHRALIRAAEAMLARFAK
ncbi:MAG: hypothetical protein HZB27_01210 [Meiothermus silvanus]|nr:hypothetical protein [Allomeiothermus silvanus]